MEQLELFVAEVAKAREADLEREYGLLAEDYERGNTMGEFRKWPSTPRWHKGLTITEKIDGTNACIVIYNGQVKAQSRKRMITPDDDNMGFAKWVYENAGALTDTLGYGYHYGEWYGEGIQKNPLGIEGKRFALFHATKYTEANGYELNKVDGLETVPLLFHGQANLWTIPDIVQDLELYGTKVKGAARRTVTVPGLGDTIELAARAEGVIVYHKETQAKYKILLENDAYHKWEQ
jgi:hypothetical protein